MERQQIQLGCDVISCPEAAAEEQLPANRTSYNRLHAANASSCLAILFPILSPYARDRERERERGGVAWNTHNALSSWWSSKAQLLIEHQKVIILDMPI